jgi:hypothetical protein
MSIKIMSRVWEEEGLDTLQTLVLLAMADHAQDDGTNCYPSMARIAFKARCSERQARRIVRSLEKAGFLTTSTNRGRHQTNEYVIRVPPLKPDNTPYFVDELIGHEEQDNRTSETLKSDIAMSGESSVTIKEPSFRGSEIFEEPKAVRSLKTKSAIVSEIYALYPRKVARAAAEKAISKALATTPAETLIEAVSAYAAAVALWPPEELQYVPFPASWFNACRWEDDRATWQKKYKNVLTAPTREVHYAIR